MFSSEQSAAGIFKRFVFISSLLLNLNLQYLMLVHYRYGPTLERIRRVRYNTTDAGLRLPSRITKVEKCRGVGKERDAMSDAHRASWQQQLLKVRNGK